MLEKIVKKTNFSDVVIIIIAAFAIVCFWRGVWNLMDKYLFPGNYLLSQLTSILIGLTILFVISEIK